ncbi:glutamate receptor ionotropic, delta-1 [Caerostris extrusa]|uniref:Glutamate receptor ionotropic, delta-1 n=1 Tax=Caerostris extrusa TaxID=172846 RepID=A0AAV4XTM3_CAEEX|nr:glutamate receptor ionotropic, delta-1 [Caerostris extrusa]
MLNQSFDEDKFSNRFLVGIWWCFCYLLSVSYAAVIASLMVIPMYEHFPKNFEELAEFVKEGEYKVIMPKGTAYTKDTLNGLKGSHVFIAETVVRNDWFVTLEDYNNPYIPSKTAVLGSRLAFYFKYGKAPLSTKYISEDTLKFVTNSLMVNKRFCCKKQIDCIIKKINKFGLFKRIIDQEIHKSGIRDSKSGSLSSVSNEDFL